MDSQRGRSVIEQELKMIGQSDLVVSHLFARKEANGWGTGAFAAIQRRHISV
jgi:hypothetical protein